MEKDYDTALETIKHSFLAACWQLAYANSRNYNGDSYYECETVSYAEGSLSSLKSLIEKLNIKVTQEEIDNETASAKKYYLDENNDSDDEE
jgi:hypothetical protein